MLLLSSTTVSSDNLTLLDEVRLVMSETGILRRAERLARSGIHLRVAFADLPGVLVVPLASAAEERRQLDPGPADLDVWGG